MSADFLCAVCNDPIDDASTFRTLVAAEIDQLVENGHLDVFVRSLADTWSELDTAEDNDEMRDMLVDRAAYCHKYLKGRAADFARVKLNGKDFLVSGGMSYGDSPAEACEAIWFLANSGWDALGGSD